MNKYICTNRTSNYKDEVENILNQRKKEILDFFEVEDNGQFNFNIYIYDTQQELKEGLLKRGFKEDPDYMCACHKDEDNSLNYFEPKDEYSENEWNKEEYKKVIFHEEIHGIQYLIYGTTPEWINEGIANYLDGTYSKGIKYLLENYINKIEVPEMEELINEFGRHEYDSYDYSYLIVSYLIETLWKKNFLELLKDKNKLDLISKDLTYKSVEYYNNKYFNNKIK